MSKSKAWMNFETDQHGEVYSRYQKLYDAVDALAAIAFIIGSALFFSESTQTAATWLFLIGSVLFGVRPMIHVSRDFHLARLPAPSHSGEEQGE
ncbi:MAG: YrhK family protein [Henriciella sp.]|uniref:YrhK family protein n=1 Tax=Henriciella sp. TaxID=1968823 RepID=UPI003C773B2B